MNNSDYVYAFCKMCQVVTRHMDLRPLPVKFKCTACGEYNKEEYTG